MARFTVDGAELAYDDEGPRDSAPTPLVLIHGWTADRHRWDHQTAHFSPHRRVIRLDLRGHGESTGAGAPTIDALARDVVALLDHLGVDRFIPVGHSMGGMTAQTLALTHPGRVERLVLVNSIGRMTYSRARGLLMAASTLGRSSCSSPPTSGARSDRATPATRSRSTSAPRRPRPARWS